MGLPAATVAGLFDIGAGVATGAAPLLGRIGQKKREKRQFGYQKQLMDIQAQNQMMLNQQAKDLSLDLWMDTNAKAQMEQLEKAGLNPALMYGQSGPGGTTATGSGGGASGGAAPQVTHPYLDISNAIEASLASAKKKLLENQALKEEAEARSIMGEEGTLGAAQIANLLQDVKSKKAVQTLTELKSDMQRVENRIINATEKNAIKMVEVELSSGLAMLKSLEAQGEIDQATVQDKIDIIRSESVRMVLSNKEIQARTGLLDSQTRQVDEAIKQAWESLRVQWAGAKNDAERNRVMDESNVIKAVEVELNDQHFYDGLDVDKKKAILQSMTSIITTFSSNATSLLSSVVGAASRVKK